MNAQSPWFSSKQFTQESAKWLRAIERLENVCILFAPKTDRPRRLDQLLHDQTILSSQIKHKIVFQVLDRDVVDIEDLYDSVTRGLNSSPLTPKRQDFSSWIAYLREQKIHLILVLPEAEKFLNPQGKTLLSLLSGLSREYDNTITLLSMFEANITHPSLTSFLPSSTNLFENIFCYPLYDQEDALKLARYLCDRWNVSMTKKHESDLIRDCGGHLWLVAEAVRELVDIGTWSINAEGMQFRLQAICNQLHPLEKQVLTKLAANPKTKLSQDELYALKYLKMMNVVNSHNTCLVRYIESFIQNIQQTTQKLELSENRIILNRIPIDTIFSRKERSVMKLLLEKKGGVVTRDDIAKSLWPIHTTEYYSDWAIDQVITRIRKRLKELSLSPDILRTVKGKGYQLTNTSYDG